MLTPLTARQRQIYDFLSKTIRENGYSPSILEIGAKFGIASIGGVTDHLKALEKKGYIRRIGRRAIEVLNQDGKPLIAETREIPVLGRIAAGKPILAEENFDRFLAVPSDIARGKSFALMVKGDSMIDAGIFDGDQAIVRAQSTAENGQIVCALIDGEATLKRFYRKGNKVQLKAENEKYPTMTFSDGDFRILGKLAGLIRRY